MSTNSKPSVSAPTGANLPLAARERIERLAAMGIPVTVIGDHTVRIVIAGEEHIYVRDGER